MLSCLLSLVDALDSNCQLKFTLYITFATIVLVALVLTIHRTHLHTNLDVLFIAIVVNATIFNLFDYSNVSRLYAQHKLHTPTTNERFATHSPPVSPAASERFATHAPNKESAAPSKDS